MVNRYGKIPINGGGKMSISRIAIGFCEWLNNISPRSQEENKVIQYGMELLLDNIIKFIIILLIGIVLGRGIDTFLVLSVFCGLRLQAGGIHAKTGLGCGFSLLLVWAISILGDIFFDISTVFLLYIYIVSALVILCCVPRTMNIEYFSSQDKLRKKLYSIIVLTFIMVVAFIKPPFRELLVCPVILEVITLLPKNKINTKGENI
ncbi:accessory gene regulator B family protein [Lacrimispora celerecrescens]|nr:accessory gene regulator B family protein [Lacrimispora celerecrescens]